MFSVHTYRKVLNRLHWLLQAVILGCLSAGVLPQDPNGLYYLVSSPEVAQKGFCVDYCGWHDVGPNNMLCATFQCISGSFSMHCLAATACPVTLWSLHPSCCSTCRRWHDVSCLTSCIADRPDSCTAVPSTASYAENVQISCYVCVQQRSLITAHDVCRYGFVGSTLRCPNTCQVQTVGPNGGSALDGVASILAHEISETISDPYTDAWCALVPTRKGFS